MKRLWEKFKKELYNYQNDPFYEYGVIADTITVIVCIICLAGFIWWVVW